MVFHVTLSPPAPQAPGVFFCDILRLMESKWTILLPTRPQPDTIVAIFLLKTFGTERFPGIESIKVEVNPDSPTETFEELEAKKIIPIDEGGGPLDHHGTGLCASELVADLLHIRDNPAIARMLAYAKRDDAFGKGTTSNDPIDRAFGLSGLIAALNKQYPGEAHKIIELILPLLEAHYRASQEHHVELPAMIKEKKQTGDYTEVFVKQGNMRLKIAYVVSDKPGMVTYLRSYKGPRADVVVQKNEGRQRVCIVTRQERHVNLSAVAGLIRLREAELRQVSLPEKHAYWTQDGKIDELPMWYVDPATNSILNVGAPESDTRIPWEELQRLVRRGLEVAPKKDIGNATALPAPPS